ncbi:condensation domain-containing protein [Blastococcus saxobsidens]|uniref:Putative CoA-dependent acyltransferase n=1 Tax=Blastococcus saxobsidens (strain DD2) TaxID=1146883 RepID=H6RL70_BLASD|nr:condensation domain-containing protein [Blastococcus saxobsidens]CCG01200.1 Putative CoA-dependent acyltransferase [Blastococcus saxobsidens DD2]
MLTAPAPAAGLLLSWPQEVLWLAERMRPGTVLDPRCGIGRAFAFAAEPDLDLLGRALTAVVERHDAVRTLPRRDGDDLHLDLRPARPVAVPVGRLPAGARDDDVRRAVLAAGTAPYDLVHGPLVRAVWLRGDTGGVLVLGLHHWAGDAAALDALQQETAELYAALRTGDPLPPAPPRYADLAAAGRSRPADGAEELHAWWRAELTGLRRAALPGDAGRTAGSATALLARPLDPAASAALLQLTVEHRASPYMVLLAALGAVLDDGRDADALDGTVFTVDGGRSGAARRTIGFLSEPLPLRLRLDRSLPLGAAVGAVRGTVLGAMGHRGVPFLELLGSAPRLAVSLLRGSRPATLVQYFTLTDLDLAGLPGRVLPTFPATDDGEPHPWALPIDLDLTVERRGAEHGVAVLYDPGRWSRADVAASLDTLEDVLRRGRTDPGRPLGRRRPEGAS